MNNPLKRSDESCRALALAVWNFFTPELPAVVAIHEGNRTVTFNWPLDTGRAEMRREVHIHIGEPSVAAAGEAGQ